MNEAKNSTTTPIEMVAIPLVKLENLIAAVEQLKAGKLRPFMYAIQGPDGEAHIDENCVAGDPDSLAIEVNGLNDSPDTGYQIVPVYLRAEPVQQPAPLAAQEPERLDTEQSREYLVRFMEQHFTDKTYHRYIRGGREQSNLAGDFAWQMARALRMITIPAASAPPARITLTGHQLRIALNLINPDGPQDRDQLDDDLTFGVRQHRDDDGAVSTGMCCWNDDTDGVLPLNGEYNAAPQTKG